MNTVTYHRNSSQTELAVIGAIAASFLFGFWNSFSQLTIRWDSGDNSYCYLVIPLFIYLCWEQRKTFQFEKFSLQPLGVVPLLISIGLIFLGEFGSIETLVYTGLWGCIIGTFIYLYGWRTRRLIFNFLILIFMVPLPPYINNMLTFKLKMLASSMSVDLLRLTGVAVFLEGNIIDLGANKLQVVDACSGLRYVMPMFLMALLIGHFFSDRFWKKLILVLLVLPLSILINGLRIYLTGMLTEWGYPELAENFFHDFAGLAIFLMAGIVLMGITRIMNSRTKRTQKVFSSLGAATVKSSPKKHFIAASLLICALFLLGSLLLNSYAKNIVIPKRNSFEHFPTTIAGWQGTKITLSEKILDSLWADDYVNIDFSKPGKSNRIFLLIPYYEYQETRHTAHAPEACLLGSGWTILQSQKTTIPVGNGKAIPVMQSIMRKGDHKLVSLYFFLQRGMVITSPWMNKLQLMLGAFKDQRTDGALVRIEMTVAPDQAMEKEYQELQTFVSQLWPLLSEYIPD